MYLVLAGFVCLGAPHCNPAKENIVLSSWTLYLFLQSNVSESERFVIGDRSFAVKRMATIHAKVLVFVRGFNIIQVSFNPAVFQVEIHV